MSDFIWHNPRCSKSRQTLELLQEAAQDVEVIEYLKTPPSVQDIAAAAKGLGGDIRPLIRHKEALFKELGLSLDDDRTLADWSALLAEHPKLIERPVVHINGAYALGRPPEAVQSLWQND